MADLNYSVKVDTKQAQDSLNGLKSRVGGLSTALKALAVGLVSRELVNTIRQFQDLRQTLITIEGDATKAAKSFDLIKKFTAQTTFQLDEVTKAFITFKNAGLTPTAEFMENIGNIAAGMGKRIDDVAQAVFNATTGEFEMLKQLGIKVKTEGDKLTVNFRGTARTIENDGRSIIKFLNDVGKVEFAGSIERQSKTLTGAISNLKDNFAILANEVGEGGLTSALTDVVRQMGSAVKGGSSLAKTIGSVLGGAIRLVADNIKLLTYAFGVWIATATVGKVISLGSAFITMVKAIKAGVVAMAALNAVMGKNVVYKVAQGVLILGAAIGTYFGLAGDAVAGVDKELQKIEESLQQVKDSAEGDIFSGMGELKTGLSGDAEKRVTKHAESLKSLVSSYKYANAETLQALDLNSKLLGLSESQVLATQYQADATREYQRQLEKLNQAQQKADAMSDGPEKAAVIQNIAEQTDNLTESYERQIKALAEKARRDSEQIENLKLQKFGYDSIKKANEEIRRVQDDIAKIGMSEIEKKHYDIEAAARESAQSQIDEYKRLRDAAGLPYDQRKIDAYYEAARSGVEELKQVTDEHYETSRTWSAGWETAYEEYIENATNAAQHVQGIFGDSMNDLHETLTEFITTGDANFKEFMKRIVDRILEAQIAAVLGKALSGLGDLFGGGSGGSSGGSGGSSGGIFGKVGSFLGGAVGGFFGRASGGPVSAGNPYLVGEHGPELFVPQHLGKIDNNPGAQTSSVTYNINAVDARSFQSLLAEDPSTLYAITEQGRQSIAGAR